ncbi:hypothetical protein [Roseomonas populi]|uniref:Uncharacterized protein n=1 Tax=Roseomonas populi TaxID=3121582 RepID=A0ABT1XAG5_9PROT|nr:hypothetical protein [Roseomonas pecuniae]MCR0985088.1 hypothetical protein [Roseomonas pecuniae]
MEPEFCWPASRENDDLAASRCFDFGDYLLLPVSDVEHRFEAESQGIAG